MRRRLFLARAAAVLVLGAVPAVARAQPQETFFVTLDDLPVMPGMAEEVSAGMVFESPQGRVVEVFATGNVREGEVLNFYGETLPQLGWRRQTATGFRREDEILEIEFLGGPGAAPPLTVQFRLAPAGR